MTQALDAHCESTHHMPLDTAAMMDDDHPWFDDSSASFEPDWSDTSSDASGRPPRGLTEEQLAVLPLRRTLDEDTAKACAVCLGDFVLEEHVQELPCKHIYHQGTPVVVKHGTPRVRCLRARGHRTSDGRAMTSAAWALKAGWGIGAGDVCAADCIQKWLVRSPKCPVCVQPVVEGSGEEEEEEEVDHSHSEYESEYGDNNSEYASEWTPGSAPSSAQEPEASLVRSLPHFGLPPCDRLEEGRARHGRCPSQIPLDVRPQPCERSPKTTDWSAGCVRQGCELCGERFSHDAFYTHTEGALSFMQYQCELCDAQPFCSPVRFHEHQWDAHGSPPHLVRTATPLILQHAELPPVSSFTCTPTGQGTTVPSWHYAPDDTALCLGWMAMERRRARCATSR